MVLLWGSPVERLGPFETLELSAACASEDFREFSAEMSIEVVHGFLDRARSIDGRRWHYCSLVTACEATGVVERDRDWVSYTIYPTGFGVMSQTDDGTNWLVCSDCAPLEDATASADEVCADLGAHPDE